MKAAQADGTNPAAVATRVMIYSDYGSVAVDRLYDEHMAVSPCRHAWRRLCRREAAPVCSEVEIAHGMPVNLDTRTTSAIARARAALGVWYKGSLPAACVAHMMVGGFCDRCADHAAAVIETAWFGRLKPFRLGFGRRCGDGDQSSKQEHHGLADHGVTPMLFQTKAGSATSKASKVQGSNFIKGM